MNLTPDAAGADVHVALERVDMAFGDRQVFRGLSCAFAAGKVSVILGGSGSGKSTVLRLIGGLVRPQAGHIFVAGEDVTCLSERQLYGVRKKLGMMFQGGALLDSLTIYENLAFPLREHTSLDERAIAAAVHRRLDAVGLTDVDRLLPSQLSGGMLRRAALARAIILDPVIVLCDEPFSGLDPVSVKRIENLLVQINQRLGITIVLVSHHIASTMRMAEHVVLLLQSDDHHPGTTAVAGSPEELRQSSDPRVVAFLTDECDDGDARAADVAAGNT
ncbi:MAG: ATP-binding cassette domain-containing protein [Deltaproteobacteria bacterium]|nr:MAG: ATP-binding cassette domain-containing protein [Deltaproteobacteria bacterium]